MKKAFTQLTWKQKNRLLWVALLLCCWMVYGFAISNTLTAKATCDALQLQIDSAQEAPQLIAELETQLAQLNNSTGTLHGSSADSSIHEQLLDLVTVYCAEHDLILREFISPIRYTQHEWLIETHPFTVEGGFIEIVKFLDHLRKYSPGNIVSADIHMRTDNKMKTTALQVTIFIQNITAS